MKTEIQRWGNSLAIRIPRAFAQETHLENGSAVNLSLEAGNLVIAPIPKKKYALGDLISQISGANTHSAIDTGAAAGSEVW